MEEIWESVKDSNGKYQISNYGRVKSFYRYERILKPFIDKFGYSKVCITLGKNRKSYLVHRLVAMHFVPNPNNYKEINHIDGNKQNNYFENLEWCTRSENIKHAFDMGLKMNKKGKESSLSKSFYQYDLNGKLLKKWFSVSESARELLKSDSQVKKRYTNINNLICNISQCLQNKHKTCCGYIFSFETKINPLEYKPIQHLKPIIAIDINTEKEYKFPYINYLNRYIMPNGKRVFSSLIVHTCKGRRNSYGGYYWKYDR